MTDERQARAKIALLCKAKQLDLGGCIKNFEEKFKLRGNVNAALEFVQVLSLLNTGYKEGAAVPRSDSGTGIVVDFKMFSPKMFASVDASELDGKALRTRFGMTEIAEEHKEGM